MLMRFQGSEWAEVGRIEVWTSPTIGRGAIVGSGARIAGDAVIPPGENRSGRCPEMSPIEVILANGTRAVLGLLAGRNGSAPAFFQQGCREWLRGFTYRNTGHGTHDEVPACRNPWDPGPPKLTDVKDDVTWASCWRTKPVPNREVEPSSQAVGRVTIQRLDRTVQSSVPPHRLAMPIYMWDSMWDAHITIIGNCMVSSHLLYVPVRIGNPPRGEFAAWRYGDQFGKRLRRMSLGMVRVGGRAGDDGPVTPESVARFRLNDLRSLRVFPDEGDQGFSVEINRVMRKAWFGGEDARRVAGAIVPLLNGWGGSRLSVQRAVREIESSGHPSRFLADVANREHRNWTGSHGYVYNMPKPTRLALEMSLHEEQERRALEGELWILEQAWKEAEEIAAIADNLLLPARTHEFFDRHGKTP